MGSPVQNSSTLFSQRKVDAALVNKLTVSAGVPVQPLYDRLEKLKNHLTEQRNQTA